MYMEKALSELSLGELLLRAHIRAGEAFAAVQLLTAAAPFCASALELVESDLRVVVAAVAAAQEVERELIGLVAGPRPHGEASAS
jgi:hypothetical protein